MPQNSTTVVADAGPKISKFFGHYIWKPPFRAASNHWLPSLMNLCCQAAPNGLATAVKISPSFTFTLRIHGEQFFIAHVDVDVERGKQRKWNHHLHLCSAWICRHPFEYTFRPGLCEWGCREFACSVHRLIWPQLKVQGCLWILLNKKSSIVGLTDRHCMPMGTLREPTLREDSDTIPDWWVKEWDMQKKRWTAEIGCCWSPCDDKICLHAYVICILPVLSVLE